MRVRAISFLAVILFVLFDKSFLDFKVEAADQRKVQEQFSEAIELQLVLERVYLDGEISEEIIVETVHSMDEFWAKYDQWQLMDIGKSKYVLRRQVDDISPLLKSNGYFGISHDGTLSIFNGKPQKANIIQSFFQIDIKKLESKIQSEILQGIPIKSKDNYVEVLETFKSYSKTEVECK